jgi:hypothetical protein
MDGGSIPLCILILCYYGSLFTLPADRASVHAKYMHSGTFSRVLTPLRERMCTRIRKPLEGFTFLLAHLDLAVRWLRLRM